jgi:Coenzyme PQQ synthesis protein D (PqqD)
MDDRDRLPVLPPPDPDVVSRRLGDEIVLVHLKTNRIFSLSPTGARFWELLSDGKSRTEIETALLREYDVSPEAVSAEIDSLVRTLEAEQLVREG